MTGTEIVPIPQHLPDGPSARTLQWAVAVYLLNKRKRLTPKSERGYYGILREFLAQFPDQKLDLFEPPTGSALIEDFLNVKWGHRAPATYNKGHSVLSDFFSWHVKRMNLMRDPMLVIEKAKKRPFYRTTFSEKQCIAILMANPEPRAQVALRLLLFYGIRKGALQNIRFEHFDREKSMLTIFTKGEKIQHIQIVSDSIWDLLDEIGAPGHHYLIPRQLQRRRRPPHGKQLDRMRALLDEVQQLAVEAQTDENSWREAGELVAHLDLAHGWLDRTVDAAKVKVRRFDEEPIGEHGLHDLWYRWLARAGIVDKGITRGERMHKARHTAAQRVLDETHNIKAAQKLLGHASSATTETYTEYSDDQLGQDMGHVLGGVEAGLSQKLTERAAHRARGGGRDA